MAQNWRKTAVAMRRMAFVPVLLAAGYAVPGLAAGELVEQQRVTDDPAGTIFENLCHLTIERKLLFFKRRYTGSAILYRGRYLLTAGHNVYQDNSRVRKIEVRCGVLDARNRPTPDAVVTGDDMLDASGYKGKPFARDFGVIRLPHPIATSQPMTLATSPAVPGEAIRFAGYPGGPHDGQQLFAARGRITDIGGGIASYDILTFKSNSGGPVWRERDGQAELLAIHVKPSGGRIVDADYRSEAERLIAQLDARAAAPAAE